MQESHVSDIGENADISFMWMAGKGVMTKNQMKILMTSYILHQTSSSWGRYEGNGHVCCDGWSGDGHVCCDVPNLISSCDCFKGRKEGNRK